MHNQVTFLERKELLATFRNEVHLSSIFFSLKLPLKQLLINIKHKVQLRIVRKSLRREGAEKADINKETTHLQLVLLLTAHLHTASNNCRTSLLAIK